MEVESSLDVGAESAGGNGGPGAQRVYLARHGRTSLNASGVLRGHLDPPLDAVGHQQAKWLAAALTLRGARLVVASPLRRAVETAQAIAVMAGIELVIDPRLIDRDYGQWAGQTKAAVEAQWGSVDEAPGVEPAAEVRARAWGAITDAVQNARGEVAVLVSHDAVNRLILATLGCGLGDPDQIPQETGSFNTLEFRSGHWTVLSLNELPGPPNRSKIDDGNDRVWSYAAERSLHGHGG